MIKKNYLYFCNNICEIGGTPSIVVTISARITISIEERNVRQQIVDFFVPIYSMISFKIYIYIEDFLNYNLNIVSYFSLRSQIFSPLNISQTVTDGKDVFQLRLEQFLNIAYIGNVELFFFSMRLTKVYRW